MNADVNALLDAMQARCDAATEEPWQAATGALVGDDYDEATHVWYRRHSPGLLAIGKVLDNELDQTTIEDAEFIAAARSDLPRLIAAVRAVLELHRPVEGDFSDFCGECSFRLPNGRYFPCPTVTAITTALEAS